MNSMASIPLAPLPAAPWDPDYFRSRLLDKAAEVESWVTARLRDADAKVKLPQLLGHKIERLQKLFAGNTTLVKDVAKAQVLLAELKPYLDLRSALAHSTLNVTSGSSDGELFNFDHAALDPNLPWLGRVSLREYELKGIWRRFCRLVNQLQQQTPDD